jgi:hypothetical protein
MGIQLQRMTEYLNKGRPGVTTITLKCRRKSALRFAKPKWPGGPLYYEGREIVTSDPVTRPNPPPPPKKTKADRSDSIPGCG